MANSSQQQPPPYCPPNQPPHHQQGQQYVHQYVQQNPQGFLQSQPSRDGFSDISCGYGYNQQSQVPQPMVNTSSTSVVVSQPQSGPTILVNPAPYSYMTPAVLTCIFCCWLTGIGAIIAAAMSQGQASEMKYDEARKSANIAKILTLVTLCCGIGGYVIVIALAVAGANTNEY
ncbi:uncharacterized protein LOC127705073 [Mytilus californianus]|uniref:uncharacterized protein LOC127705073 n=1 Tax=Mytilus californianus TaxID=6549 RepID=UPI002246729F|nr:uncharacterized protein LOC127705073 [Mytilus californianus]XP_052065310.1 uncharacterized protein LOC127705073 [Mytilus californianus]XP_052065311.1 uncharacterized protein LOC127705073 [Mytilus californianus]